MENVNNIVLHVLLMIHVMLINVKLDIEEILMIIPVEPVLEVVTIVKNMLPLPLIVQNVNKLKSLKLLMVLQQPKKTVIIISQIILVLLLMVLLVLEVAKLYHLLQESVVEVVLLVISKILVINVPLVEPIVLHVL